MIDNLGNRMIDKPDNRKSADASRPKRNTFFTLFPNFSW